jgi:hypothetical protein
LLYPLSYRRLFEYINKAEYYHNLGPNKRAKPCLEMASSKNFYIGHIQGLPPLSDLSSIAEKIIHFEIRLIEQRRIFHLPADKAVEGRVRFIEDTDPDAVGVVAPVANPESEALFRIDVPFVEPVVIGKRRAFIRWFVQADGVSRSGLGELAARLPHPPNTNRNRLIRNQRQIGKDLADANPVAEPGRDQKTVAPDFS